MGIDHWSIMVWYLYWMPIVFRWLLIFQPMLMVWKPLRISIKLCKDKGLRTRIRDQVYFGIEVVCWLSLSKFREMLHEILWFQWGQRKHTPRNKGSLHSSSRCSTLFGRCQCRWFLSLLFSEDEEAFYRNHHPTRFGICSILLQ